MEASIGTTLKGQWKPGVALDLQDDMGGGITASLYSDGSGLTIHQSRPGLHPLYYALNRNELHFDEQSFRLHRKMRQMGVAKPKIVEVEGGDTIRFNGKTLDIARTPIPLPATVPVLSMADAQEQFADRLCEVVHELAQSHGPVVLLLSGGVDSISVLWALKEVGVDVIALTAGRSEQDFDPFWAKKAADYLGVPWELVRLPEGDLGLQTLLTRTLGVIEQTSFSNVLMGMCCELIRDRMKEHGRSVAYMGFWADLLFGHKLQTVGNFNQRPAAQRSDQEWTRTRIEACWHSKPHSLQLAKGMRYGGETTWRVPFTHRRIAPWAFGLPQSVAPAVMNKALLYGMMDRVLPRSEAAWHVQKKIGFYTGAGIGKIRLANPVLQDRNIQATYKAVKARMI
jgi:asparagine synthetase B (glutamine-hydrolysing)